MATFLRWNEDDVDEIAPSLYGKGRRKTTDTIPPAPPSPAAKPPTSRSAEQVQNGDHERHRQSGGRRRASGQ